MFTNQLSGTNALNCQMHADWKDPYWRKEGQRGPYRQYGPSADKKDAGR